MRKILLPLKSDRIEYAPLVAVIAYLQAQLETVSEAYRDEVTFELSDSEDGIKVAAFYYRNPTEAEIAADRKAEDLRQQRRDADDAVLLERLLARHGLVAMPAVDAAALRPKRDDAKLLDPDTPTR